MEIEKKIGIAESSPDWFALQIENHSANESFVRVAVSAFLARLDPTLDELDEVKTAVSEAVTNAVIHAYPETKGMIRIVAGIQESLFSVWIEDDGCGISDIKQAMEPMYTGSKEKERSGMGFCFMEAFMDEVIVRSQIGKGTSVQMKKNIRSAKKQVE